MGVRGRRRSKWLRDAACFDSFADGFVSLPWSAGLFFVLGDGELGSERLHAARGCIERDIRWYQREIHTRVSISCVKVMHFQ